MKRYSMLPEGSAVLVGFSGGADSMALLSVLWTLAAETSGKVVALHVNHGIRGEAADRDEKVCSSFCESRNIPFYVLHANIPEIASETGEGLEECGRRIRYEWFQKMGTDLFPDTTWRIATAHNANDSVETVLFHLARGTSLKGMTGIPPVRDSVIRPLIDCTRAEIESYCEEESLSYVTDYTNFDNDFSRNRLRNLVLPEIQLINPNAVECISRSSRNFALDEEYLEGETFKVLEQSRDGDTYLTDPILCAPKAIGFRVLAEILGEVSGVQPETKHIEALYGVLASGGQLQIPTGLIVRVHQGVLSVLSSAEKEVAPFSKKGAAKVDLPYGMFIARKEKKQGPLLENVLDYDKISGDFIVRNRRPGDRFRPPGRKVSKSLKSLFEERRIPVNKRSSITILEKNGEIAWMEGFGPSEDFAADDKSRNILIIQVEREVL